MPDQAVETRLVYIMNDIPAVPKDSVAVDGWKKRVRSGPHAGHVLEDFQKEGTNASKLQPTGEIVPFISYWDATLYAGRLIKLAMNAEGWFEVIGAECPED
ncbi:MAG: hypothetical protein AAFX06_28775 [Planctomycetota bacterium]